MLATSEWQSLFVFTMQDVLSTLTRILEAMKAGGFDHRERFGARLALEEALVNAIRHGNRGDASKWVDVRYQVAGQQMLVEIQDQGPGFDPDSLPDPRSPENLERAGGRGVFLIRHYMTWVQYNETGNCVTLCKLRSNS